MLVDSSRSPDDWKRPIGTASNVAVRASRSMVIGAH